MIRSLKAYEYDTALSVDLDQISKEIGMTVVKLKESGAVQLKPEYGKGGWSIHRWRSD